MIKVIGKDGNIHEIMNQEVPEYLQSGEYTLHPDGEITIHDKEHGRMTVPASQAVRAIQDRSMFIPEETLEQEKQRDIDENDPLRAAAATVAGVGRGVMPFAGTDWAMIKMGIKPNTLKKLKEDFPELSLGGEIGGFVIPTPTKIATVGSAALKGLQAGTQAMGLGNKALKTLEYAKAAAKPFVSFDPALKWASKAENSLAKKFLEKKLGDKYLAKVAATPALVPAMAQLEASNILSENLLEDKGFNAESLFTTDSLKKVLFGSAVAQGIPFIGSALFDAGKAGKAKLGDTIGRRIFQKKPNLITPSESRTLKHFGAETGSYIKKHSNKQQAQLANYLKAITSEDSLPHLSDEALNANYQDKLQEYLSSGKTKEQAADLLEKNYPDLIGKAKDFVEGKKIKFARSAITIPLNEVSTRNNYFKNVGIKLLDDSKIKLDNSYEGIIESSMKEYTGAGDLFKVQAQKKLKGILKSPIEVTNELVDGFNKIIKPNLYPKVAERFNLFADGLKKQMLEDGNIIKPSTLIDARRAFDDAIYEMKQFSPHVASKVKSLRWVFEKHLDDIVDKTVGKNLVGKDLDKINENIEKLLIEKRSTADKIFETFQAKLEDPSIAGDQEKLNAYIMKNKHKFKEVKKYDDVLAEISKLNNDLTMAKAYRDYQNGKMIYKNSIDTDEIISHEMTRERKNNFFSLTANIHGGIGALVGGLSGGAIPAMIGAGIGAAFRKGQQEYGDAFMAYYHDVLHETVMKNFSKVGQLANDLVKPDISNIKRVIPISLMKVKVDDEKLDDDGKKIEEFNQNPETSLNQIRENNLPFYDIFPDEAVYLEEFVRMAGGFLNEKNPYKVQDPLVQSRTPSNTEKTSFTRYLNYVDNPETIFDEIAKGYLSSEALETLQRVYPTTFQTLQEALMVTFSELNDEDKNKLNNNQLRIINQILGNGGSRVYQPQNISFLQSNFQQNKPTMKNSNIVGKGPSRSMTESQMAMNRRQV